MPKILYINIIWFSVVIVAIIMNGIARYSSTLLSEVPDIEQSKFFLFDSLLVCIFIISFVGIMRRKKWGFAFTVSLNYVLTIWPFMPIMAFAIYCCKSGLPISEMPLEYATPNILSVAIAVTSFIFALLIRRKSVSSVFENM
jgi:uncharacterized membrane protein YqaE (UPF0057 family)